MTTTHAPICRRYPEHILWLAMALLTMILLLAAAGVHADTRVYELNNRPAGDVATQIRELYQNAPVTVSAHGQQMVVRAEPQLLDEIDTLVSTMDVAPAQLRITVRSRENIGGKQSGTGLTSSGNQVGVTVTRKTISTGSTRERTLLVQDGQSAHISSGQIRTLPFAIRGGRNPAAILQQVQTRSGFVVSPRVISGRTIELEIVSFEEDPAALPGYETEALMTLRQVEPGQWVSLGGVSTQTSDGGSGIAYRVNSNRQENRNIEVKVDILP